MNNTSKILAFIATLQVLVSCEKPKEITFYLKKNDGSILKVVDSEVSVLKEDTIAKITKLRERLKKDYPLEVIPDKMIEELKSKQYAGPFAPEEVDYDKDRFWKPIAEKLGKDSSELMAEVIIGQLQDSLKNKKSYFSIKTKLRVEWDAAVNKIDLSQGSGYKSLVDALINAKRNSIFVEAKQPANEAAEVGGDALQLISDERIGSFKTDLEGKVVLEIPQNTFLYMSTVQNNTFITWLVHSSLLEGDKLEVNQEKACILETLPQSIEELFDDMPTMSFFENSTPFGESNAVNASLVSDAFYLASKLRADSPAVSKTKNNTQK
jgi:hypothetical protein